MWQLCLLLRASACCGRGLLCVGVGVALPRPVRPLPSCLRVAVALPVCLLPPRRPSPHRRRVALASALAVALWQHATRHATAAAVRGVCLLCCGVGVATKRNGHAPQRGGGQHNRRRRRRRHRRRRRRRPLCVAVARCLRVCGVASACVAVWRRCLLPVWPWPVCLALCASSSAAAWRPRPVCLRAI